MCDVVPGLIEIHESLLLLQAEARVKELMGMSIGVKIVTIGKKAAVYFKCVLLIVVNAGPRARLLLSALALTFTRNSHGHGAPLFSSSNILHLLLECRTGEGGFGIRATLTQSCDALPYCAIPAASRSTLHPASRAPHFSGP